MKKKISALMIGATMVVVMIFCLMPKEVVAQNCSACGNCAGTYYVQLSNYDNFVADFDANCSGGGNLHIILVT